VQDSPQEVKKQRNPKRIELLIRRLRAAAVEREVAAPEIKEH
jgi:hypothetical protein